MRNEPAEFPLNGIIPGWTDGIHLMTGISNYKFSILSALAHGAQCAQCVGNVIERDSTAFEVDLLSPKTPV